MAITQVTTETIDGVVIGLSATIGELIQSGDFTVENLTPYMICGQLNKLCPKYGSLTGAERSYSGSAGSLPPQFPNVNTGSAGGVTVEFAQDDNLALSHDMYGRNILIYGSLGTPQIYSITNEMSTSNLRLVTSIDFKKIYYDVDMAGVSVSFTRPDAKTITNYQSGSDGKIKTIDNDEDTNINVFSVVDDGENNSWYCLIDDLFPKSNSYGVRWLQSTTQYMSGNYGETYATLNDGWNNFTLNKTLWRWSEPAGYLIYGGDGGNWGESFIGYIENGNNFYAFLNYTPYGGTMQCIADGLEYALNQLANTGLKFKWHDTWYKPISDGGIITGYTDDMTSKSEWDDITNVTGNTVPVTPSPTPPTPSGDIETDMPLAYIGGTAGMVDFIKINEKGLASADDISDAISRFDIATIGKDLLRNFVAFKCYAVLNIDDSVVRDIKISGHTLKNENDNALQGEYIGGVAPVDFSAGTVEHLYNDYRDYAPYTKIQMYVPFCGWFDLPSWCMGKEITGTMFTDLYNGTVKSVIYASRTVVAEVGGCCAFDIPFAAESTGVKAGAVISSALNTVAMTGATIAAPNIATGIAAVSSAANFISAANSNGTTLKGVMGDGSNTNGLLHVYLKITRPKSPNGKKEIPDKYKHEYGIPCYKQLTLTAGDGYTQIMDANIEGAMTDREKQMIIDGFRHGLIL